ncbi:hypothetical protein G5I_00258 [Acromyrmex echinatior]|uniref:Uncharacterized protein n=1 Tax=Acromyrmex echinatior TaxID=103372 RepID=F4W4D8_ACREC|nr:hypothetical protein G5I_00258 [Acromyrmex echinatior]
MTCEVAADESCREQLYSESCCEGNCQGEERKGQTSVAVAAVKLPTRVRSFLGTDQDARALAPHNFYSALRVGHSNCRLLTSYPPTGKHVGCPCYKETKDDFVTQISTGKPSMKKSSVEDTDVDNKTRTFTYGRSEHCKRGSV